MRSASSRHSLAVISATATTVLLLSGCAAFGPSSPTTPTAAPTQTAAAPTQEPTVEPTASPTGQPESPAEPIGLACDALLPIDPVYDLNPNLSVVPDAAPPAGTLAANQVAGLGVACNLVHNSSGAVLRVAAAKPGSVAIAALRASATEPYDLGAAGTEAFLLGNAIGAFRGTTVFTAEAADYFGPEELAAALRIAVG